MMNFIRWTIFKCKDWCEKWCQDSIGVKLSIVNSQISLSKDANIYLYEICMQVNLLIYLNSSKPNLISICHVNTIQIRANSKYMNYSSLTSRPK